MDLLDHDIASIAAFLSSERLSTFQSITGSMREAILLHQQMLQLGTTLMSVTAVIEVAIRNAICERISTQLGGGWLRTPPASFVWDRAEKSKIGIAESSARKAVYAKMPHAVKKSLDAQVFPHGIPSGLTHDDISKERLKQIVVADGQIIAQLTMAFWKRLFSSEYEYELWDRSLKYIFPDKKLKRSDIATQFEEIYQARNRIAHHEPIYDKRLERVMSATKFVLKNFGARDSTGKTPLAKLLNNEMNLLDAKAEALKQKINSFRQSTNALVMPN
jgi:hypothetical protein